VFNSSSIYGYLLLKGDKMKKLFMVLVMVMLMAGISNAQTWYPANQVTLAWDAVPKVQTTDQANKYQVYSRNDTVSAGSKIGGEITATQLLISFTVEGQYYLGVEAIRYPVGATVGIPSATKAWSNVAADTNNNPFGVSFFTLPGKAINLRLVP
jgi:hypothetical protein